MKNREEVWVFIEQRDGKPAEVSFELLSKGRKLSNSLNGVLKSVIIGHNSKEIAQETFQYGAEEAIVVNHPDLRHYNTMPYSRIMCELVAEHKPRIVLYGATPIGRDLAPRVASYNRCGLTADCTDLQISNITYLRKQYERLLLQIRPAFGGNIIATIITPDSAIQMATVREGVMEMIPLEPYKKGEITKVEYTPAEADKLMEIIYRYRSESKVNLKSASIIVAGGYGMGSKENFKLLYELADTIGGEVGGSRAAVDAGFVPYERQIGQTGVTVRPKLYIACGISGAIQHRAGMQNANRIVAISTDPDAPIFEIANYKIVGDAMEVIPLFIEAYKHRLR
jgi:electron transfer flavoprotein alpha subunit